MLRQQALGVLALSSSGLRKQCGLFSRSPETTLGDERRIKQCRRTDHKLRGAAGNLGPQLPAGHKIASRATGPKHHHFSLFVSYFSVAQPKRKSRMTTGGGEFTSVVVYPEAPGRTTDLETIRENGLAPPGASR
jgi:hypothetical protein